MSSKPHDWTAPRLVQLSKSVYARNGVKAGAAEGVETARGQDTYYS